MSQAQAPSVRQLRAAYVECGQPNFLKTRSDFEKNENGTILEEWYAKNIEAAAVLIRKRPTLRVGASQYKIILAYDSGLADDRLAAVLRRARLDERENSAFLEGRSWLTFELKIYTIIVHLLAVWDSSATPDYHHQRAEQRLADEITAGTNELDQARQFAEHAASKSILAWYLLGLPIGALICFLIIRLIWSFPQALAKESTDNFQIGLYCAFGAVGAILSVMVRITSGSTIGEQERGRTVTVLAGAFRPIVGAVFGVILYVFAMGGLLPFKPLDGIDPGLFFAGLAFLAGFSERWAQDTIVRSYAAKGGNLPEEKQPTPGRQPPAITSPMRGLPVAETEAQLNGEPSSVQLSDR